jgi:hypothetical protein
LTRTRRAVDRPSLIDARLMTLELVFAIGLNSPQLVAASGNRAPRAIIRRPGIGAASIQLPIRVITDVLMIIGFVLSHSTADLSSAVRP